MSDAINAAEAAIYGWLSAAITGAAVYQHPPEDAAMPIVIIGDIETTTPIGAKGDPDRIVPVTIVVLTEGEERRPCSALVGQIEAMDGVVLSHGGFSIHPNFEQSTSMLAEQGAGYVGLVNFKVFALAD